MLNKRGQGMSINAVIIIVLGIIVLAVIVLGFTLGWDKFVPWLLPSNNVNEVKKNCEFACLQDDEYSFCYQTRELRTEGGNKYSGSCNAFAIDEGVTKLEGENEFQKVGIDTCPRISCPKSQEANS